VYFAVKIKTLTMAERVYLGIDLGAESGRVMAGVWNGKQLRLEEVHRFANGGVFIADTLRWDVVRLWSEIQTGLGLAGKKYGDSIVSVGADTWGVDFVLMTKAGEVLGLPYHYRDVRTQGALDEAFKTVPRAELYAQTGLQFMELNTLYQLLALKQQHPDLLAAANDFLFMPDFLHYCLCGARVAEYTIASTSQCLHPSQRDWNHDLLAKFGLPAKICPKIVQPGTNLGTVRASISERTGLRNVSVIAPPAHDTASAVAGVPTANTGKPNWAYLSSGTWSLLGAEIASPVLTPRARTQHHQRRRHRRHHPAAQEHHRPLAHPAVQTFLRRGGQAARLRRADQDGRRSTAAALAGESR